ncbi:MAG: SGNH/GDSL hydrolase family protein [Prevotella sp.]|nr:SGNH/GDSL hydrolase family protein [Prevotella sp.]
MLIAMGANAQCKKSVAIFGDSYSTFENYLSCDTNAVWYFQGKQKKTDVTDVEQTWWHMLLKEKGWKLECNNSFSGSTICYTGYRKEDYQNRSFHNRLRYLGSPDIILVFGATNDCWAKSPIGDYKYSDWTKKDLYSFRPAMAAMCDGLKKRYPNVDIYFIMNCDLTETITTSCRTICNHYGIPMIELHDVDKINGHPSIKGMKTIAEQVGAAVK